MAQVQVKLFEGALAVPLFPVTLVDKIGTATISIAQNFLQIVLAKFLMTT